jgi:Uma2 family endonuclease
MTTSKPITLADLMADDRQIELIDGEIREMSPTGFEHATIAANIYDRLRAYALQHQAGYVRADGLLYVLREAGDGAPRDVRVPDVSFIRKGGLPAGWDRRTPFPGAPDLAVEVISPSEYAHRLRAKITAYLAAGTAQVWAVYPTEQEIHTFALAPSGEQVRIYGPVDVLQAPDLLPGFALPVQACFVLEDFED